MRLQWFRGPWAPPREAETIKLALQPVLVSREARAPLPGSTRALGLEETLRWSAPWKMGVPRCPGCFFLCV